MSKKELQNIANKGWISRWAGSYTFISCSCWGYQYTQTIKKILGIGFDHILFIHRKGVVFFYVTNDELLKLGTFLAKNVKNDNQFAIDLLEELKKNTDILTSIMEKLKRKIPSLKEYNEFYKYFDRYLAYQVFMKKTIDYLDTKTLNKLSPKFKDARIYAVNLYSDTEKFFRNIAKNISQKENCNKDTLTCLTRDEFVEYIKNRKLPDENILKERYKASVLYFENHNNLKEKIFLGKDANELEKLILEVENYNTKSIKGTTAFPGKVRGICRIVPDPHKVGIFNKGDILVTGMTRPEFMPLMEKSSAIVTDVGGILCHAAITSRELKKPCIINTRIASKVLKDGEKIEVDAEKGIVKKI